MAVDNLTAVTGVLFDDRRRFYLDENTFSELYMSETPFLSGLMNVGSEATDDPDYKMFEYRATWANPYLTVVTTAAWGASPAIPGTDSGVITVSSGNGIPISGGLVGALVDIWVDGTNPTSAYTQYKGTAVITTVPSATTLTLKVISNPNVTNQAAAAIVNGDKLWLRTSAAVEGAESGEAFSNDLQVVWNSTQIIRTPLEMTGTLASANLRGEKERQRQRINKGREHMMKLERAIFNGVRTGGIGGEHYGTGAGSDSNFVSHQTLTAGGTQLRTTMGVIPALVRYGRRTGDQQNVFFNTASTYSFNDFVDQTDKLAQYAPGGGEFVAYCGSEAYSLWSKIGSNNLSFAAGQIQIENTTSDLGLHVKKVFAPSGVVLNIVRAPALNYGQLKTHMVVVNPENAKLVSYRSNIGEAPGGSYSAVTYNTNIKTDNGYDGVKDEYVSDVGVGLTMMESHALMVFS